MKHTISAVLALLFVFSLAIPGLAQSQPLQAPSAGPAPESTLPAFLTEAERDLPLPFTPPDTPPTGFVVTPAEYEPMDGMLLSWRSYTTILTQMTVAATNDSPPVTVWIVVPDTATRTSATNTLTAAGANMSRVQFIIRYLDTVWIRDYGPRFVFVNGTRAMVHHNYNRPRPNDNALTGYLGGQWGETVYELGLTHGGGNYHSFWNQDAFMSTLIQNENAGYTAQQIKDLFHAYEGANLTIYTGFPTSFDSTQHIDMWMQEVGDNKIIIGQYAQSTGQPYTITEAAVANLVSRGYTVYRTPGWNSGGTHYTYTNAVVLNNRVFISKFNVSQDATALATYQAVFPGYTIQQIDNSGIIGSAGAMHCIMMHVPTEPSRMPGDTNCDGLVDFDDINPFVVAMSGTDTYFAAYPRCRWLNADVDSNGLVDFDDINPFVALLSGD